MMRQNCKKSLLIAILIAFIGFLLVLSFLEDMNSSPNDPNQGLQVDSRDETLEKSALSFKSLYKNNSSLDILLFSLRKFSFIGTWSSEPHQMLEFFTNSQGKMKFALNFQRNSSKKYEFSLYDGEYIDQKFLWLPVFENVSVLSCNSSRTLILCENLTGFAFFHENFVNTQRKELKNVSFELQLGFKDENSFENQLSDSQIQEIDVKNLIFLRFRVKSSENSLDLQGEMAIDTEMASKIFKYSIMLVIIAVLNAFACFSLIQKVMDNENQGNTISLISLSFAAVWDMYLCILHFLFAVQVETFFQYLVIPAFCYFALFTVFETRLLMIVWKARYFTGPSNIEVVRRSLIRFYVKFYLFLTVVLILTNNFIMRKEFLLIINMYLVPQIVHSAIKGQLITMDKVFIFGIMVPRSILVLYVKGCPYSIFEVSPNYSLILVILSVISAQILIIYLQEQYGPRFFLPKCLFPHTFNYFVDFQERDLELCAESSEVCAICLNPLHFDTSFMSSSEESQTSHPYFVRKCKNMMMRGPCNHTFHAKCLMDWMKLKMECPICRHPFPAISV